MDKPSKLRVLIAEDHPLYAQAIVQSLKAMTFVSKADIAADGEEVLKKIKSGAHYDLLLLDIEMPKKNGVETLKELRAMKSKIKVICISTYDDGAHINTMQQLDVDGYMLKQKATDDELRHAIEQLYAQGYYFPTEIKEKIFDYKYKVKLHLPEKSAGIYLSHKEKEIVKLIAKGFKSKEIGEILNYSVLTVMSYRRSIYKKLGCKKMAAVGIYALKHGLLDEV